jgi:hypothetical protein
VSCARSLFVPRSPDVLSTVGETSYGIRVELIESDIVFTILLLFVYLYLRCTACACLVNEMEIIF